MKIDFITFDRDGIANLDNSIGISDILSAHAGNMNETVLAGENLDKGAIGLNPGNGAGVDLADFGGRHQSIDVGFGLSYLGFIHTGDSDTAVLINVDLDAKVGLDLTDHFAARPDQLTNLVGGNLGTGDLRGVDTNGGAGRVDNGGHFVEDRETTNARLSNRFFENFGGDTGDFNVHLHGGDTVASAGDFEVHITEVVFDTGDVTEGDIFHLLVGNETHGDTGHRFFDGDTGVHQGEGTTTDRSLGGRTIAGHNFGNNANGIGKLVFTREYGYEGPLGQGTVTNFTTVGVTDTTGFADGEAGHIVVVHVAFGLFALHALDKLFVGRRTESDNGKSVGQASLEETGTVGSG